MRELLIWTTILAALILFGAVLVRSPHPAEIGLLLVIVTLAVSLIGGKMATPVDRAWLPGLVFTAFIVKLIGAGLRYVTVVSIYRSGDAYGYHDRGTIFVEYWRSFTIPTNPGGGSEGTRFVEMITGLIYVPYVPSMLGGFFIFATLSFLGQLLLYAAFRRSLPQPLLRRYAVLSFFLPTMVFWPSSIGKDALMVLFIGIASYGAARMLDRFQLRWVWLTLLGMAGAAAIRIHVAALLAGAVTLAAMFARRPSSPGVRRLVLVLASGTALVFAVILTSTNFNFELSGEGLDPFLEQVGERTSTGGSAVDAKPVSNPLHLPEALLRVLFRPFPFEAHNVPALLSSLEGTVLFLVFVWKIPAMLRHARALRRHPYLLFASAYTMGFVIGFSAILNLGILARQRSQVMPLFLAWLITLGWYPQEEEEKEPEPVQIPFPQLAGQRVS